LGLAREHDGRFALLINGGPSYGSGFTDDGAFAGRKHVGASETAANRTISNPESPAPAEISAFMEGDLIAKTAACLECYAKRLLATGEKGFQLRRCV